MAVAARILLQKNYRLLPSQLAVCAAMPTFKRVGIDASLHQLASRKGFERERAFPRATIITPNGKRESGSLTAFGYVPMLLHSLGSRIKPYGLTGYDEFLLLHSPYIYIDSVRVCIYSHDFLDRSNLRERVASFIGFKLNFVSGSAISLFTQPLSICSISDRCIRNLRRYIDIPANCNNQL